jgi:hypothetical protein
MSRKLAATLATALALGALALVAEAQQHRATRLGNPNTRFAKPLKKPDDLRVLLRSEKMKADVAAVLADIGWPGDAADLDRAAASADVVAMPVAPNTRLPFMAARKKGKAYAMRDVLWAGKKPIDAYGFEFTSKCVRYKLITPKACSNFWIEDLGKDTSEACNPKPVLPPVVSLSGASSACVTQPVEFTVNVQNPPSDGKVVLSVNDKELTTGTLSNGQFRTRFPGAQAPGTYVVKAVSGGQSATATVEVKPCVPTCGLTVTPNPAKAGKPITVDVSGSRVAPGVAGGIKTVKVEIVQKGAVVQTLDMPAPSFARNDVVVKKGGLTTVRAVVTDEAGQTSTNTCSADIDVKGGFPIFAEGYFGKERLTHDDPGEVADALGSTPGSAFALSKAGTASEAAAVTATEFSRCSPLAGLAVGIQPMISDKAQFEGALGVKFAFDDQAHTAMFANAAINRVLNKGFFGGGVSWWDIGKDTSSVGLLLQGGVDLDKDGKWQLVGQTRVPFFNQFDNIDNNYELWGGIRFRPNSWK